MVDYVQISMLHSFTAKHFWEKKNNERGAGINGMLGTKRTRKSPAQVGES